MTVLDEHHALLLAMTQAAVNWQAEDEGLWFQTETAPEAYLQQSLRDLHAVVEGDYEALKRIKKRVGT